MRIGLVRHFPVQLSFPTGWRSAAELARWREDYDAAPVAVGSADLGTQAWPHCLCSDLERAVITATTLYPGPVERSALLREVEFAEFQTGGLRLPLWVWRWVLGVSWMTGHRSQRACRDEFRRRVTAVADMLEGRAGDVLVVSHGGLMRYLSAELSRRGFRGPKLRLPRHATLYVYER